MNELSKLKKNLTYQTVFQLLNTCIPLITSPYLARTLGATSQGVFSYTQSIVNYFVLFAMLGVTNYGTRTIASCKKEKNECSISFWNIYVFQCSTSLLAMIFYLLYIVFVCKENYIIACIQVIYLLGALIDINWLFFGVEKFVITVKRSIIIRIISLIFIFVFVKSPNDLWIYTIIMAGSTFLSNIVLWVYVKKIIYISDFKKISITGIIEHIKPNLILFIPLLAMSIYHIMDKTMLGILSTYEQTGFYYNADKVINIPISIINGVGTVMMPRMTALVEAKNERESEKLFYYSLEIIIVASTAMTFGISAISSEFVPLFFGKGFEPCIYLIMALSPVLIVKSLSQTARMQFLIPTHKEKIFIESVLAGAIVNFFVNFFLIPLWGAMGAVVGTLVAETVTCGWQYFKMRKMTPLGDILLKLVVYIVIGLIMFWLIRIIAFLPVNSILLLCMEVIVGGSIFISLCFAYWNITKNPLKEIIIKNR